MDTHVFVNRDTFINVSGDIPEDLLNEQGSTLQDCLDGKYVLLSDDHIDFLAKNPGASVAEVLNMEMGSYASDWERQSLIEKIKEYDKSDKVNTFYVNDTPVWWSREDRVALNNSIAIEEKAGMTSTTIWINDTPYSMDIDNAKNLLMEIELYAIKCYNNTKRNILKALELVTRKDLIDFNITEGYPDKLTFNL